MSGTDPTPEVFTAEYLELSFSLRTAVANFHLLGSNNREERIRWMDSALNTLHDAYTLGKKDGQERMRDGLAEILGHVEYCLKGNWPVSKKWVILRAKRALDLEE